MLPTSTLLTGFMFSLSNQAVSEPPWKELLLPAPVCPVLVNQCHGLSDNYLQIGLPQSGGTFKKELLNHFCC